ncbi:hypothetical protein HO173_006025 [Letharia columbiana]|uniref:Uncharacterized protein n=1 Tax=Letharia columbiana TaxID=112416 RepID=A0A8H6FVZ4_9LECA|nr:uncharacterized protein HO173_006025 [Letharia columbiana]KAF6235830.1 hypothetical protein HO173_006025 [Letharia columbiana]
MPFVKSVWYMSPANAQIALVCNYSLPHPASLRRPPRSPSSTDRRPRATDARYSIVNSRPAATKKKLNPAISDAPQAPYAQTGTAKPTPNRPRGPSRPSKVHDGSHRAGTDLSDNHGHNVTSTLHQTRTTPPPALAEIAASRDEFRHPTSERHGRELLGRWDTRR